MKKGLIGVLGAGIFGIGVGVFGQTPTIPLYYLNGNIGIGITNPASKLVVFDDLGDVNVDIRTAAPGNDAILNLIGNSGGGSDGIIQFKDWDGVYPKGAIGYKFNTGDMTFSTSANERMRITAAGKVGIGTAGPDAKLHLFGTGAEFVAAHIQNGSGGSGIANIKIGAGTPEVQYGILGEYGVDNSFRIGAVGPAGNHNLQFHTGNTSGTQLSSERMRITSAGNVGIGTPSPTELLHVNGNIRTMVGGVMYTDTVSGMNCTFNIKAAGAGDPILFSQGYAERMRIWNGNVGIGTTSPERRIDQVGSIATGYAIRSQISNGVTVFPNTAWVTFEAKNQNQTAGNSVAYGFFTNDASGNDNYAAGIAAVFTARAASNVNADLAFTLRNGAEGHLERMRILSGGNIGIGTSTPTELLQVNGNISTSLGGSVIAKTLLCTTGELGIKSRSFGDDIAFYGGTTEKMRLASGDLILPGTQSGSDGNFAAIVFRNTAGNYGARITPRRIGADDATGLLFYTSATGGASTERIRIDPNGNVGIGTPTPTERLDVSGNVNVSGTLRASQVIVTTESWADYVFEPDYILMPLADVRQFIATKKHLPEIPSESDLKKTGTNVNKMQALQMKKIEELTLYILQLEDRIKALEALQPR